MREYAAIDRVSPSFFLPRCLFILKILVTGICLMVNVLTDWLQLATFAKMGLWIFATCGLLVLLVPPLLCYVFRRYMVGYIPPWFGLLFMMQFHIFQSMKKCFTTGKVDFSLISATVFEGCFEAYLSAFLGVYAVSIAPHLFLHGRSLPLFFGVFGPRVDPFLVLTTSFCFGIVNMGKTLCYDLDFYGWGRLYIRRKAALSCYRVYDGVVSAEPHDARLWELTEYSATVKYTKDKVKAEIPLRWLCNVPPLDEGPAYLRHIRFLYRLAEVTHSCLTLVVFSSLCRREHLSIHHNGNMWPVFFAGCDYLLMWYLLKQTGKSRINWFFAAFLMLCSPPLMLPQFRSIYVKHHLSRIARVILLASIVIVKIGWSDILRRLELVPWLRRCMWLSTAIWLCLIPVQYYLFERDSDSTVDHSSDVDVTYAEFSREDDDEEADMAMLKAMSVSSTSGLSKPYSMIQSLSLSRGLNLQHVEFPRILCAALSDKNRLLLSILASIMPLDGTLSWAFESYDPSSDLLIADLIALGAEIEADLLKVAVENGASHRVTILLLKAGAKPSGLAWKGFFERKDQGTMWQLQELVEAGAKFPEDVLDLAVKKNAPHEQLVELLRLDAAPKEAPIKNAVAKGDSLTAVLELFTAGAEVYDNVLSDAVERHANHDVILELLRQGGTPRYLPLKAALKQGASLSIVEDLLQARAEIYDGALSTALGAKAHHDDVLVKLLRLGASPASAPLRHAIEISSPTERLASLLEAKAELYEGVLQTAVDKKAPVSTLDLLLRAGGTPRNTVLAAALQLKCSDDEFQSLMDAKAEPSDGLLQAAYAAAYDYTADDGMWKVLVSLGVDCAYKPEEITLHQDMDRPFSHYWISSSHNTYLEGAQFNGTSTAEQYIKVLKTGCRCVEIDIWDGPIDPIVTHGHAFCSTVPLIDVVKACNQHAFEKTDFPLILSIEMRCNSSKQWGRCIEIFKEAFGDKLLLHPSEHDAIVSPSKARGKVLIKSKLAAKGEDLGKGPDGSDADDGDIEEFTTDTGGPSNVEKAGSRSQALELAVSEEQPSQHRESSISNEDKLLTLVAAFSEKTRKGEGALVDGDNVDLGVEGKNDSWNCFGGKKKNKSAELQATAKLLATYNRYVFMPSVKFKGEHVAKPETRKLYGISSFRSSVFPNVALKHATLREYHAKCLSRTYPRGTNVNSENYNPLLPWYHGVQMVALNYQTFDKDLLLNEGFFRHQNGGIGYVLKPLASLGQKTEAESITLQLRILSGYGLSPNSEDFSHKNSFLPSLSLKSRDGGKDSSCYIKVKMYDALEDVVEMQTKTVLATNSDTFIWNIIEDLRFDVRNLDIAMLTVEAFVNDQKRFVSAHPVRILREGVRLLPLWGLEYEEVKNCNILTSISIKSSSSRRGAV